MTDKKVFSINPEFFKINTTRKKKPDGPKPSSPLKVKSRKPPKEKNSKTIKRNLLNYIRNHQKKFGVSESQTLQQRTGDIQSFTPPTTSDLDARNARNANIGGSGSSTQSHNRESEFQESLNYLMKLSKKKESEEKNSGILESHMRGNSKVSDMLSIGGAENRRHNDVTSGTGIGGRVYTNAGANKTIKNYSNLRPLANITTNASGSPPISEILPLELVTPSPSNMSPVRIDPPYGCMKNGTKETYRKWMKRNNTQKSRVDDHMRYDATGALPLPNSTISSMRPELGSYDILRGGSDKREPLQMGIQNIQNIQKKLAQINYGKKLEKNKKENRKENRKRIPKHQKTLRRTFRVGKSRVAPKVSVLVSNKTIRKNIYTQSLLLKQTPIKEVKRYLIKHGFIRVGSIAPNHVLRKMYENARLICGELKNHNPDNILYNFLHGDGEEQK